MVVTGKDKGKKGKILKVFPKENKAVIENINLMKKAIRRTREDQKEGIVQVEAPVHLSNVMLVCKQCNNSIRTKVTVLKDGAKIRECKKCGSVN